MPTIKLPSRKLRPREEEPVSQDGPALETPRTQTQGFFLAPSGISWMLLELSALPSGEAVSKVLSEGAGLAFMFVCF